jgi:hypothetical protein
VIYIYALVDDSDLAVTGLHGLADAPLVLFSRGGVSAVCTIHDDLRLETDPDTMWQHERVTATLMTRCAVAPVRFGTVLSGTGHLEQMLAAQEGRFVAVLARLRGKVELAVRGQLAPSTPGSAIGTAAVPDRPPTVPSQPGCGRGYLKALQETYSDQPDPFPSGPLADIHATLASCAEASTAPAGTGGTMVAAYLVDADGVASFRRAFMGARNRHRDVRLSLTGPWAPFSFVEDRGMAHV